MTAYVSIGAQCTTATLFDKMNVKKYSLPFDWMFSTPEFVYTMLKYLLLEKKEIAESAALKDMPPADRFVPR